MQRPSGTAAVRLSLWMLLFAAFAMSLVQPATAGTEAAPEIQDPAGDPAITGPVPGCAEGLGCFNSGIDVVTVWIDNETATDLQVHIRADGPIAGGVPPTPAPAFAASYNFHVTIGAVEFTATVVVDEEGTVTLGGAAANATVADTLLTIQVLKSAIGNPTAGAVMGGIHVETELAQSLAPLPVPDVPLSEDTAPDTGADAGVNYTFTGGSGGPAPDPDDTDGDGMNDTCEMEYFGDLTHNETADEDGDGLTNGQECVLGTDPTNPDSDGDGTNDKDDPAPTDPTVGGTTPTSSSSSSSSTSTSSSSTSTSRSTTTTSSSSADTCADGDSGDAADCLQSNLGYVGMSAGGFLAVVVLCIIGLAVRWSL